MLNETLARITPNITFETLKNVTFETITDLTIESLMTFAGAAMDRLTQYATVHPYLAGFQVASIVLTPFLGAGFGISKLLLKLLGFGPLGPIAGTIAAWYQSTFLGAYIPAGGIFAWAQHLGMA
ncbi:hypothetical protein H2204_009877 [Knufia peltigerae]|uniref:Uncharacterized protein n=1 Tax=Knufia peltigerae TaxID=1002370 RepID=A0AA39CVJ1_9EURO|nr:hypothetical protein H2204_009877 [Knufia peltigerae]